MRQTLSSSIGTVVLGVLLVMGVGPFHALPAQAQDLVSYVSGLSAPTCITSAQDGTGRLFICEKAGKIQIAKSGLLLSTPFLDITSMVSTEGERGLVSVAFHPQFQHNRKLYIFYVDTNHDINIAEYRVMLRDKNRVDRTSRRTILRIRHRDFSNHNGGQLAFGPDGYLYIGVGDGGSGGDPSKNGQNKRVLLAKILRIDVNAPAGSTAPYLIPRSNPYAASTTGARREIFAYGFRNPWRFSFDPSTKQLFAGDVGQDRIEEVDIVVRGHNYGWSITEGDECYNSGSCNRTGITSPIHSYAHDDEDDGGQSITGGYVYRGRDVPALYGKYIFGDFVSGRIWTLTKSGGSWTSSLLQDTSFGVSTFGVDGRRELYVADYGGGTIYKMIRHVCGSGGPQEQVC